MMNLSDEILDMMAGLRNSNYLKITMLPDESPAFVFRQPGCYGVVVEVNKDMVISESFNAVHLKTQIMGIEGTLKNYLSLYCEREVIREKFAALCAEFISPGLNGRFRTELLKDPLAWWKAWSEMLGNVVKSSSPYQVLGELLTLIYLLEKNGTAKWLGPYSGVKDIEIKDGYVEVKSTLSRYDTTIVSSGQYQLLPNGKDLFLSFCRFEETGNGISINRAMDKLVNLGLSREVIINALANLGYEQGNSSLNKNYTLLEMRLYEVDSKFPVITPNSFVGGKLPDGIIKIQCTIDLSGLKYMPVNIYF